MSLILTSQGPPIEGRRGGRLTGRSRPQGTAILSRTGQRTRLDYLALAFFWTFAKLVLQTVQEFMRIDWLGFSFSGRLGRSPRPPATRGPDVVILGNCYDGTGGSKPLVP